MIGYEELHAVLMEDARRAVEAEDGPLAAGVEEVEFQLMEAGLDLDGLDRVSTEYALATEELHRRFSLREALRAAFGRGVLVGARAAKERADASD